MGFYSIIHNASTCRVCGKISDSGKNICKHCISQELEKKHNSRKERSEELTAEEIKEVKKLYRQLWPVSKIAKQFGTTRDTIQKILGKASRGKQGV